MISPKPPKHVNHLVYHVLNVLWKEYKWASDYTVHTINTNCVHKPNYGRIG